MIKSVVEMTHPSPSLSLTAPYKVWQPPKPPTIPSDGLAFLSLSHPPILVSSLQNICDVLSVAIHLVPALRCHWTRLRARERRHSWGYHREVGAAWDHLRKRARASISPLSVAHKVLPACALSGRSCDQSHAPLQQVLFIEKQTEFRWHPGMLLPNSRMQIRCVKRRMIDVRPILNLACAPQLSQGPRDSALPGVPDHVPCVSPLSGPPPELHQPW